MALLERSRARQGSLDPAPETHIRRCNYRRLIALQRRPDPLYDVECLYGGHETPLPLGDLPSARSICDTCQATKIFRPDED